MNKLLDIKKAEGDCCPLMTLVLSRARVSDKIGLCREPAWDMKSGTMDYGVFVRFHKARGASREAQASYALANYCPFCGASLKTEKKGDVKDRPRSSRGNRTRDVTQESRKGNKPVPG